MISVDEAWQRISSLATPLPTKYMALDNADGHVLAEEVQSTVDLPPFDNSAMDGYALHSSDTVGAGQDRPISLELRGEIAAGQWPDTNVEDGTAVKIMTGAPVPSGADTVLRLEDGRLRSGRVELRCPLGPGVHIRRRGEDMIAGQTILKGGSLLNVQHLGLLASGGVVKVKVRPKPRIALLATGSELAKPSQPLKPGQIYNSNSTTMKALAGSSGCAYQDLGVVKDDADSIRSRIESASNWEILMISGGVSVGQHDHVKKVLKELGVETVFWRVKMKPGKPLLCGRLDQRWIFGLPGNPISCVAGFLVFIEPLIRLIQGQADAMLPLLKARLSTTVSKRDQRRHFMTAFVSVNSDGQLLVAATKKQGSAMMNALAQANSFIVVPENRDEIAAGETVDLLPIGSVG